MMIMLRSGFQIKNKVATSVLIDKIKGHLSGFLNMLEQALKRAMQHRARRLSRYICTELWLLILLVYCLKKGIKARA